MSSKTTTDPLSPEEKIKQLYKVYEFILSDQFALDSKPMEKKKRSKRQANKCLIPACSTNEL
jgi:hypothetical protein